MSGKSAYLGALAVALAAAALLAAIHNVPISVSPRDRAAAIALMKKRNIELKKPAGFEAQLELILQVQDMALDAAPTEKPGIPPRQPRELSDLLKSTSALCFDQSRAIETILRVAGFKVRHVNAYAADRGSHSILPPVIQPDDGTASHSLTEVLTDRGWILVDSNYRYVGLTDEGVVFDIDYLSEHPDLRLHPRFKENIPRKLRRPFMEFYGLYSRHGLFYPPYNRVPDVNWRELLYNVTG